MASLKNISKNLEDFFRKSRFNVPAQVRAAQSPSALPRIKNFTGRVAASPYLNRVAQRADAMRGYETPLSHRSISMAQQNASRLGDYFINKSIQPNTPGIADNIGRMAQGAGGKLLKVTSHPLGWAASGSRDVGSGIQNRNPLEIAKGTGKILGAGGSLYYGGKLIGKGGPLGVLSRAGQGAVLNTAMNTGSTLLREGRLPTVDENTRSAQSGVENSWTLAITNAVTDKVLASLGVNNLVGNAITEPFKDKAVKEGFKRVFTRALAEVPAENTAFTWLNRLDGQSKESFMNDWITALPGSIASNLAFAFLQGSYNTAKNTDIGSDVGDTVNKALNETLRKWNTPVTTMELDKNGRRITVPMWQYKMQNKMGFSIQDINKLSQDDYTKLNITEPPRRAEFEAYRNRLKAQGVPENRLPTFGEGVEGAKATGGSSNVQSGELARPLEAEKARMDTLRAASQIEGNRPYASKLNEDLRTVQNKLTDVVLPRSIREGGGIQITDGLDKNFAVKPVDFDDVPTYKRMTQPQVDVLAKAIKKGEINENQLVDEVSKGNLNMDILQRAREKVGGLELLTKFNEAIEEGKLEKAQNVALKIFSAENTDPISQYRETVQNKLSSTIEGRTGLSNVQLDTLRNKFRNGVSEETLLKEGFTKQQIDAVRQGGSIQLGKSKKNVAQQPLGDTKGVKIVEQTTDSYAGQTNNIMKVFQKDKVIGNLQYSETPNKILIDMVEVDPSQQGKGYAKQLVEKLYKENPNKAIDWGMQTESGAGLKKWAESQPWFGNKAQQPFGDLTQEARKYKSAEEFVNKNISRDYLQEVVPQKSMGTKGSSLFTRTSSARKKAGEMTGRLEDIAKKDQSIFDSNKTKTVEQLKEEIASSKRFADEKNISYPRSIQVKEELVRLKSQLTDIWNKAQQPFGDLPKELSGKISKSNTGMGGIRSHTSGKVDLGSLKIMENNLEVAKNNPLYKVTKDPIIVGVDIKTGEKQLLDGYHRFLKNDGKGIVNAKFIPMDNGDIVRFSQLTDIWNKAQQPVSGVTKVNDLERGSIQLGPEKLNTILSRKQNLDSSNKSILQSNADAITTKAFEPPTPKQTKQLKDLGYLDKQLDKIGKLEAENILKTEQAPFMRDDYFTEELTKTDVRRSQAKSYVAEEQPQLFENSIRKWVGGKSVAETEGGEVGYKYKDLLKDLPSDKDTFREFVNHVEGVEKSSNPVIQKVGAEWKQDTDALYAQINEQAKRLGINDLGYVDKYATHYWKQDDKVVQDALQRLSKSNPSFKGRTFETYQQGIEMGLTPKYESPERVMAEYVKRLSITKNNLDLFETLKNNDLIVEGGAKGKDFEAITVSGFPRSRIKTGGKVIDAPYYAPKDTARKINQIFTEQNHIKWLENTAKASARFQNVSLSGGGPATPINAFFVAQLQKEFLSGNVRGPLKVFALASRPKARVKYQLDNAGVIKEMQANNFLGKVGISTDSLGKPDSFGEAWDRVMTDPTFKWGMPMLQIEHYKNVKSKALEQGLSNTKAIEVAGKSTKNFYGLIDPYKYALSNVDAQNAKTTFLFAPHYREAMINFWKNNIRALKNPLALENRQNVKFIAGSAIMYGVMNALNNMFNGHSMSENPDYKKDKLLIPAGDKTIGIPFLSSIATVPRGVIRELGLVAKGDYKEAATDAFQTFASMAIKPLGDIMANSDYFGRPVYDENDKPIEKQKSVLKYLGKQALAHPWVKAVIERIEDGKPENALDTFETLSTAGELPFRFYNTESILNSPFWEKYDEAKSKNEAYRQLKYKDPDKAQSFYIENRELIEEYPEMRKAVDNYFDEGDANALVEYMGGDIPEFARSDDAPTNLLDKWILYGKSTVANPIQTYQAISNSEPIRKLRVPENRPITGFFDSSTITERKLGLSDLDMGDKSSQVDHIIPKWIGGRETSENYQLLSNEDHARKTELENQLRSQYENGDITRRQALKALDEFNSTINPLEFPEEKPSKEDGIVDTTEYTYEEGLEEFSSGQGQTVKSRAQWAYETLSGAKDRDDFYKKYQDMLDANIMTRSVADAIIEMGIPLTTYTQGGKEKRIGGSGSTKGGKTKKSKINWTPKKLSTSLPKLNIKAPPKINIKAKNLPVIKAQKARVQPIKISGFRNDLAGGFTKLA